MLRIVATLFILLITLVSVHSHAAGRVLLLNGYVDGLPFPWRLKSEIRIQLEAEVPGIAVHAQSLDLYRPQPEAYKALLVELIKHTYGGQIDLIVALDPLAFEFYQQRLKPDFADVPVIFSNDRGENPNLGSLEYSVVIRPDLSETLRIAKHHYPQLKRLYILGDDYNQSLAESALSEHLSGIELIKLGHLSLDKMREQISGLGEGDLLLFQLLFADGEGTPMIPPVRYVREFAQLNPMPTLCMYANFIDQGCLGGSVSSPKTQANAIVQAVRTFTPQLVSSSPIEGAVESDRVLTLFASESVVNYEGLQRFGLNMEPLSGVRYLNKPQPFYVGYEDQLAIAVVASLVLLIGVSIYLLQVSRQRKLLHRFVTLTDKAPTGIFWTDNQNANWHANQRAQLWAKELDMSVEAFREAALTHMKNHRRNREEFRLERAGKEWFFRVGVTEQDNKSALLMLEDTTALRSYQARLEQQATHDELTQLPNRRALQTALEQWCMLAERDNAPFAIMMIDLDGFKEVNDQFGHQAGDDLLIQVASRLKMRCRQNDIVGRLGGDEFLLLVEGIRDHGEVTRLANSILELLCEPYMSDASNSGDSFQISASIGIGLCPEHSTDESQLQICADRAMYQVKQAGKRGVKIYDGD